MSKRVALAVAGCPFDAGSLCPLANASTLFFAIQICERWHRYFLADRVSSKTASTRETAYQATRMPNDGIIGSPAVPTRCWKLYE